ncbi:MAG: hypothetical protein H6936_14330 [Burkholderiales bacterium]|nr:hypothetical protein [Burkholderiales bacterium]
MQTNYYPYTDLYTPVMSDLAFLEQNESISLRNRPLWPEGVPADMQEHIEEWSEAMSALQLDAMVEVYHVLLHGKAYPAKQIQSLIKDWYRQYGHRYARKNKTDSESISGEAVEQSQGIIRYGLNPASLYDGLAEKDGLGRKKLVDAMAKILTAKENHQHQTIGLLGDWGAGKSTFVNLLKDKIKEINKTQFLFAEFNAWEYEHTDHMQAGVAREALKGLTADLGWWGKWRLAFRLSWQENPWYVVFTLVSVVILIAVLSAISWADVISALHEGNLANVEIGKIILPGSVGIAAVYFIGKYFQSLHNIFESPLVNQWKRYLTLPDYDAYLGTIPVMKRQIKALCRLRLGLDNPHSEHKRLLFVVDDLDRCSHTGVVKTLEAVRLIMGIPQVTVIIAIDQHIALASLALHYEELAQHHTKRDPGNIARDYLGKVIQLPVQLRPADAETVAAFVDQVLLNGAEAESPASEPGSDLAVPHDDSEAIKNTARNESQNPSTSPEKSSTDADTVDGESGRKQPQTASEPSPTKPQIIEKVEYQFSPAEKEAFRQRVQDFNFRNPRQLKRLYNSFNLLRHLYGSDRADNHMWVLFWLEYQNNLPVSERETAREGEVWERVRKHFEQVEAETKTSYEAVERKVQPFVLPALDQPVQQQTQQTKQNSIATHDYQRTVPF